VGKTPGWKSTQRRRYKSAGCEVALLFVK